ncbi:MAG: hypothetical protein AAF658_10940 [Myxococcota bacterium]
MQKAQNKRRTLERDNFTERYAALQILERLPSLASLDEAAYADYLSDLHDEIIDEGQAIRAEKPALGVEVVCATPQRTKLEIPRPPWFDLVFQPARARRRFRPPARETKTNEFLSLLR